MHGTVLIDADGRLTRETAPLWNDKRNQAQVDAFGDVDAAWGLAANLPSPAWPAFKLRWLLENDAQAMARTATVLMPKDWINFNLTGQRGQDVTEASLSFLMDWWTCDWSPELCAFVGTDRTLLPRLAAPGDVLAGLSPKAAASLGLAPRIPVLVGGGDCPMALLGAGVAAPGMGRT